MTLIGLNQHPQPGPPINYPSGASEFKNYKGVIPMFERVGANTTEDDRFKTISDFKWCVKYGGEIEFVWNNKLFGVSPKLRKTPGSPLQILISQVGIDHPETTEQWYDTADELLEYRIDGVRLRDIITEVEVTDRTI